MKDLVHVLILKTSDMDVWRRSMEACRVAVHGAVLGGESPLGAGWRKERNPKSRQGCPP
jgi:hypothetical protein